jgi:FdhD protein
MTSETSGAHKGMAPTPEHSLQLTQVVEWNQGQLLPHNDALAAEEPLEICIGNTPLTVTMRTPGHDEELAAGFLLTEGLIESPSQIIALRSYATTASGKNNGIEAALRDCELDPAQMQRNFFAASSCGICG